MSKMMGPGIRLGRAGPVLALVLCLLGVCPPARGEAPFPALYPAPDLFTDALARYSRPTLDRRVTGLTVPHHLLAIDLLTEAFSRLRGQAYHRVVILCPDHFTRSQSPFAVAGRDFDTCFGPLAVDATAVERLLSCPLVATSPLFSQEHGIHALTPFLARYFPQAGLVAVAIRKTVTPEQLDTLAAALTPLLDDKTLLIQSTDFSHYLAPAQAARMDRQTLRLLADPDPRPLLGLNQPGHVDCRGALYLQRKLQHDVYRAEPTTVANRNSQAYAGTPVARSTSYMVQYYSRDPTSLPGPNRIIFAGDTFFGRFLAKVLARPGKRRELVRLVRGVTGGAPLVVNLEGALARRCHRNPGPYTLCMPRDASLALLRDLNVKVVGLANNHVHDLGTAALARMVRDLTRIGITALPAGAVRDVGPLRITAMTDLDNADPRRRDLLQTTAIARLAKFKGKRPLCVLVHWGREFAAGPDDRERELARSLRQAGATLVIGSHPHRTWSLSCDTDGCVAWSLGNFLFDQSRPETNGALVEVRFFRQGTQAIRLLSVGNLYRRMSAAPSRGALAPETAWP